MLLMNSPAIQRIPTDELRLSPAAVRRHPTKEIEKLRKLLAAQGQVLPVLAAPNGEIIVFEAIWLALKANGATEVDALIVTGKSPAELKALQLSLNRIPLDATWDAQNVRAVLEELIEADFDLDLTGFDAPEIDYYLNLDVLEADVREDRADIPPLQERAVSKPGDIWALERHRIGCGCATDLAFVRHVLGGTIAAASFIDPPLKLDGCTTLRQQDREFAPRSGASSADEYFALVKDSLRVVKECCAPAALVYACIDWRHVMAMTVAGHACDMPLSNICVWTKPNGAISGIYRDAHELVCVFGAGAEMPSHLERRRRRRNRSNVWSHPATSPRAKGAEPIGKPVAMIADALREVTKVGAVVLDTFLGCGSTLMAAQQTGRICCGVELVPCYLDAAIRRWQHATGRDAILLETGERFNALSQRLLIAPTERTNGL